MAPVELRRSTKKEDRVALYRQISQLLCVGAGKNFWTKTMPSPTASDTEGAANAGVLFKRGEANFYTDAAQQVREELGPKAREVWDFFAKVHFEGLIKPGDTTLSVELQAKTFVVRDEMDWFSSGAKEQFSAEVEAHGFLGFDTESYLEQPSSQKSVNMLHWSEKKRMTLAQFSTANGTVCLFDLERMMGASPAPVPRDDPFSCLPSVFRRWLRSPEVLTMGGDIRKDADATGLLMRSLVDSHEVFKKHSSRSDTNPVIDIGITAKHGLGVQAVYAKAHNYKPMRLSEYKKYFGDNPYRKPDGSEHWPSCRNLFWLYQWPRTPFDLLKDECVFYCVHDVHLMSTFPATLLLDMSLKKGYRLPESATVKSTLRYLLGGFAFDNVSLEALALPEADVSEEEDWDMEVDDILNNNIDEELLTEGANSVQMLDSPDTSNGAAAAGKREEKEPNTAPKYARKWDRDTDLSNPYQLQPALGRRCEFCGGGGHALFDWGGRRMCPKWQEQLEEVPHCLYKNCSDPKSHLTRACPTLHAICPDCWHRGHGAGSGCEGWGKEAWATALQRFEEAATIGHWTRRRHHDPRWSFFPAKEGSPFPYPKKLRDLLRMTVAQADTVLKHQRVGVRVSAGKVPVRQSRVPPPAGPKKKTYAAMSTGGGRPRGGQRGRGSSRARGTGRGRAERGGRGRRAGRPVVVDLTVDSSSDGRAPVHARLGHRGGRRGGRARGFQGFGVWNGGEDVAMQDQDSEVQVIPVVVSR